MGNTLHKTSNAEEEQQHEAEAEEDGTCEICVEPITAPSKIFRNCSHPFCIDCIIKYIQVKIEDNTFEIPCPALHCPNFLNPLECRHLIPRQLMEKWCHLLCESAVLALERCYCPNRDCSDLVLNECGGVPVKRAVCPRCNKAFCFQCKTTWHAGYTCRQSRDTQDADDVALGVLAETNEWQRCPSCHGFVERVDGCNTVICRCGKRFCYKCGEDVFRCRCGSWMFCHICLEICCWILAAVFCVPILIGFFLYYAITSFL